MVVLGYNVAAGLLGRSPVGQTLTLTVAPSVLSAYGSKGPNQAEGIDEEFIIHTTALQLAKKKTVSEIWGESGVGA